MSFLQIRSLFFRIPQKLAASGLLSFRSYIHTTLSPLIKANQLPPRPKINEDDIEEVFLKGGGKGGQKINKTNSKVQLKHLPTGIVVSSQFSRSREQNRAKAREILALKVEELTTPPGESRAEIVIKYKQNKVRTKKRKAKRKYAALAAAKQAEKDEKTNEEGEEGVNDGGANTTDLSSTQPSDSQKGADVM